MNNEGNAANKTDRAKGRPKNNRKKENTTYERKAIGRKEAQKEEYTREGQA